MFKIIFMLSISICIGDQVSEEYDDSVINMLLNGDSRELETSNELDHGEEPTLLGGIWKCGSCDNIDESKLIYTEVNEVYDNMMSDVSVDIQVGFTLPSMQCITVQSDSANTVRRVTGSCTSGIVTLSIAPASHFTVHIYN